MTQHRLIKLKSNALQAVSEQYEELLEFYEQISNMDNQKMVLVEKRT